MNEHQNNSAWALAMMAPKSALLSFWQGKFKHVAEALELISGAAETMAEKNEADHSKSHD